MIWLRKGRGRGWQKPPTPPYLGEAAVHRAAALEELKPILREMVEVEKDPHKKGRCLYCDPQKLACNSTFLMVRNAPILPGFWRTNELSLDIRACFPAEACTPF